MILKVDVINFLHRMTALSTTQLLFWRNVNTKFEDKHFVSCIGYIDACLQPSTARKIMQIAAKVVPAASILFALLILYGSTAFLYNKSKSNLYGSAEGWSMWKWNVVQKSKVCKNKSVCIIKRAFKNLKQLCKSKNFCKNKNFCKYENLCNKRFCKNENLCNNRNVWSKSKLVWKWKLVSKIKNCVNVQSVVWSLLQK